MMEKLSSLIGPERERIQNHNWDCAIFSRRRGKPVQSFWTASAREASRDHGGPGKRRVSPVAVACLHL